MALIKGLFAGVAVLFLMALSIVIQALPWAIAMRLACSFSVLAEADQS